MAPHRVFLVRHGETEWSKTGQHTGKTDLPLTEAGEDQGRLLTERLKGVDFALVLTSPLQRARETCRQAGLLDRAEVSDDLHEWDYGRDEGLTTPSVREQQPGRWDPVAAGRARGSRPGADSCRGRRCGALLPRPHVEVAGRTLDRSADH